MGEAAKLFTRALLMGADASARKNEFAEPTAGDIENLPYAEAVEYLKKRSVIKKVDYDKLSDKMRFRAFTVSRINDGALLEKLNAEMLANVRDGKGLKDFLSLTKTEILDKVGMGPGQGWRWETVYRTNVQTAFNAGRAMGFAEDKPLALELIVIDDARTSDTCRQYAGRRFVLPYDHPFWQTHWPPFHFNCRTTIRAIYSEDELPEEWSNSGDIEDANNGFGANPLSNDNWWNELASQVRQAKRYDVQGEIEAAKVALEVEEPKTDLDRELLRLVKERQPKEPEPIFGFKKMNPKAKRKAICNWLIRKGMKSGKERFVIARSDGSTVVFKKGSETGVYLGGRVENFLEFSEPKRFIFYHNHPYSGSFSYADMKTLNKYPSLREMVAVGHNGTVYSLKVGKRLTEEELKDIFSSFDKESEVLKKLVKKYKWGYTVKERSI
ncbi:MAG: minor capsid protein [Treponema sp.]|nr:minor capsid protein [Treponema sp.]